MPVQPEQTVGGTKNASGGKGEGEHAAAAAPETLVEERRLVICMDSSATSIMNLCAKRDTARMLRLSAASKPPLLR
jgi:protein-tyrosine-phosphatase